MSPLVATGLVMVGVMFVLFAWISLGGDPDL